MTPNIQPVYRVRAEMLRVAEGELQSRSIATTRVGWSTDASKINAGIDQMTANGKTSISDGFEAAELLFDDARPGATNPRQIERLSVTRMILTRFLAWGC